MTLCTDYVSPNFNERDPVVPLQYIVIHYTGMTTRDEALTRLCDANAKVSAHYVVDEMGKTYKLAEETKRAWHAGRSFWQGITDLNSASIGVELVNPGHEFGYRTFPELQINSLIRLLNDSIQRNNLNPRLCLLGHSDIAPTRKKDPGEFFPWQELAAKGLGIWPSEGIQNATDSYTEILQKIGYDVSDPVAALIAFQRRFMPRNLSGKADPLTLNCLAQVQHMFDLSGKITK